MRYFGPFKIEAKIGTVAYRLSLPPTAKIHPVFHVSQLKPFRGNNTEPYMPLPLTVSELGPVLQPIAVTATRTIIRGQQQVTQILVQWENGQEEETSWEDLEDIKASYPHFNLEDKVAFKGEGNVTASDVEGSTNCEPHNEPAKEGELGSNKPPDIQEMGRGKRKKIPSTKLT